MTETDASLLELVDQLTRASARASELGRCAVAGVRAVEARPGWRHYLCALDDGRVGCLDDRFEPVMDADRVREVIRTALLVEHAEQTIDSAALRVLTAVARRVAPLVDAPGVSETAEELAGAADTLVAWREAPERALATVSALDGVVSAHDAARRAHIRFIAATDPLVPIQDTLSDEVRNGLRELETTSAEAGVNGHLAAVLAGALASIDTGTEELFEHLWDVR